MAENQLYRFLFTFSMHFPVTLLFLLVFVIASCGDKHQVAGNQALENRYFDLAGFVQEQMNEMENSESLCTKVVSVNGKREEKEVSSNVLEQELKVFIDADINKPAWSDKYTIDSVKVSGALQQLNYNTDDPKMKTRSLAISFTPDGKVSEIYVRRDVKSIIADTYNEMYLWPGKGYEINTIQSVALSDTTYLQVKVSCQR